MTPNEQMTENGWACGKNKWEEVGPKMAIFKHMEEDRLEDSERDGWMEHRKTCRMEEWQHLLENKERWKIIVEGYRAIHWAGSRKVM